jgi:hypothetical protein
LCPFSGHKKNTDGSGVGWMISMASVVIVTLKSENIFYSKSGVSSKNFTDGFLLEFDFFLAITIDSYNCLPCLHSSA